MTALEKLQALARRRRMAEPEPTPAPPPPDLPARLLALLRAAPGGLTDAELAAALPGVAAGDLLERVLDLYERGLVQAIQEPGGEWRWQARAEAVPTTETTKTTESVPALEAAVRFDVRGVGDVWLIPDAAAADKLGIPAGQWVTPADLALLEGLEPADRLEVLRWMRETGGRLVAAPAPTRRYGWGERGWTKWRLENIDRQAAEYRAAKKG